MIGNDIDALSGMVRDSAGEGERQAAEYIAGRLRSIGVSEVRTERFRGRRSYAPAHAAHTLAGLLLAARTGLLARLGALALLASLELDASGRFTWVDRLLPSGQGTNAFGRIPPRGGGAAERTLVIVAHHDAARTGLVWNPRIFEAGRERRLKIRRIDGFMLPVGAGFALAAIPFGPLRRLGAVLLGVATAAVAEVGFGSTVPGASDNASGVAATLALAEELVAAPLDGVEVLIWSVGCEESGMDGMRSALASHALDPATTFILGLDTLGAGAPILAAAEGTMLTHRYGESAMAVVDAAADEARLQRPERWRIGGWTDPILARFAGHDAVSLLSIGPDGLFTNYHVPTDTADRVDLESVDACLDLARAVIDRFRSGPKAD